MILITFTQTWCASIFGPQFTNISCQVLWIFAPLTGSTAASFIHLYIFLRAVIRGHSQMTLQHWTTNGNLKSWRKLTRRDQGSSEKMMDDEKSNDSWESIQKRPKLVSLGLTGPLLGQMDSWLGVFNDRLDSKDDHFWFRAVHKWRHQFEAPRGRPKADDRLT